MYKLPFQQATHVDVYSDTDWAGCVKTRKSTGGGCTQPSVSLSSGEAEYYGVVKASGVAIGHRSLMADLGIPLAARVWTDSSAAIGICNRAGLSKLRHVQTHTLWVQERLRNGEVELRKVKGEVNPADLFTRFIRARDNILQLLGLSGCEYRGGRAESAPRLRKNNDDGNGHARSLKVQW